MNLSQYDIIITVTAAASLFVLLTGFVVAFALKFQKRRQQHVLEMTTLKNNFDEALLQSQIEVQEATFSALGKELHDNVGQLLSSTKMLLGVTQRSMTTVSDTLNTAEETLGKAINELRSLSKSLNKEWLEQFSLLENLQAEANRLNESDSLKIHLAHSRKVPLKSDEQTILFRIMQEAVQNAVKHANAQNLFIVLEEKANVFYVSIRDDGDGFKQSALPAGVGILNMKHRIKLLGGTIEWLHSKEDKGTTVAIQLPVKPAEV